MDFSQKEWQLLDPLEAPVQGGDAGELQAPGGPGYALLLMQLSTACVSCVRDQITIERNEFQA